MLVTFGTGHRITNANSNSNIQADIDIRATRMTRNGRQQQPGHFPYGGKRGANSIVISPPPPFRFCQIRYIHLTSDLKCVSVISHRQDPGETWNLLQRRRNPQTIIPWPQGVPWRRRTYEMRCECGGPPPSTLGRRLSTRFEGGIDASCRNQRGKRILQATIGPRFLACSIPSRKLALTRTYSRVQPSRRLIYASSGERGYTKAHRTSGGPTSSVRVL